MDKEPAAPGAVPVIERPLAQTVPEVLAEPRAGGNYLRDPVTGVLSLNPDHPVTDTPQE